MSRLPRPHVPFEVRCRVLLRQLGELFPDKVMEERKGQYEAYYNELKSKLAALLHCTTRELHLDHDPPLASREKILNEIGEVVGYFPDANDPKWLIYRVDAAHKFKTNVRGEGAQYPDRALIKRQRRREEIRPGGATRTPYRAKRSALTPCTQGARCACDSRERKTCANWRTVKIPQRRR